MLVPTGMATYHMKGHTIHSGIDIDINKTKLLPLTHSDLKTLWGKHAPLKTIIVDEISVVGKSLF